MSSSQEMCLPESTEIDSEGSSCEEREGSRRRLYASSDPESLPKKRRKQSTPVKFSTSLSVGECGEDSEEEPSSEPNSHDPNQPQQQQQQQQHKLEGKPTSSPLSKSIQGHHQTKDENLNNEFRCQFCSQFFDSRAILDLHLECEHNFGLSQQSSRDSPPMITQARGSPETTVIGQSHNSEQPISPMNLSGISIRNFANSWLAGQSQMQTQNEASLAKMGARNNNHFQPMPPGFPGPLAQFLPMPGFPGLPDSTQIQRAAIGQFPKIFNPDAYCELCNKEFCNKYFLKTHKANKHRIYTDPPVKPESQTGDVPTNPFIATANPSLPVSMGLKVNEAQNNGLQLPTVPCDMCPKRFKNEDSLRKHRQKIHSNPQNNETSETQNYAALPSSSGEEEIQSPGGMETLFKQEYNVDQEETNFVPPPRSTTISPQVSQIRDTVLNGDRLRQLGVMNPEAFCEICCKEYCNKTFLRTHKYKKHGIFIPDGEKPSNVPGSASWHQIQTSPLNLIMADSFGNGSESGDRTEIYACNTCKIRFQTQDLYLLHLDKIHGNDEQSSPKPDQEIESTDQRNDSISEDLQKLQTMILQLKGLNSNKAAPCILCGKEYESPNALKNHMVTEHNVLPENLSPQQQQLVREKLSPIAMNAPVYCNRCEKEFPNQEVLKKHIEEDHQPSTPSSSTSQLPPSIPTTPKSNSSQQNERKVTANITPTSSFCEICKKELCNKYFMKTHMAKMHGIEIENGAQIGGVVCNICNKELCSKYFLRVHKQNTHGIVEEGAGAVKQESFETPQNTEDLALRPEQIGDLSHRYIAHFTEVCPICNRRFRSSKWLKEHLQKEHGKAGIEKWREMEQYHQSMPKTPSRASSSSKSAQQQSSHANANLRIPNGFEPSQQMRADLAVFQNQVLSNFFGNLNEEQQSQTYRCPQPLCNFSTSMLPLMLLHERSHTHQENVPLDSERVLQCPVCPQTFAQLEMLRQHIVSRHPFPGILSQLPIPLLNDFNMSNDPLPQYQEGNEYVDTKEELRQSSPQIMNEIDTNKMRKQEENNPVQVMPPMTYKCTQCGFTTPNHNRIKKHVNKDHWSLGDPVETALAELSKTLKDVANKRKVPASYAIPQDANLSPDKAIMQGFIIEELDSPQNGGNGCSNDEAPSPASRRFAPALIYLPVKTRVDGTLTLSFTLNPA